MKIIFLSIGKKNDALYEEAISDFTRRINKYVSVEWKIISHGKDVISEEKSILNYIKDKDKVILLDERGDMLSSKGLAEFLNKELNNGTYRLVFVIGGAYGVSDGVRKRSSQVLSFSKLTFPHQIMRLVLAEQIYRAFSILKGEKYHHE